jgi:hypothetical protein
MRQSRMIASDHDSGGRCNDPDTAGHLERPVML